MEENPKSSSAEQDQAKQDTNTDQGQRSRVHDLFSWKSLNRPAWQYSKDVYTTLGAIGVLVSIIFAFFQEWLAIVVVWAAYFLFWALSKVPPVEVEHKITTEGIVSINKGYLWGELGPFWFSAKGKDTFLHVAHFNIFGQLIILIDQKDQERIRDILAGYLPFVEVPGKSMTEKMADWFSKKFPLHSPSGQT